MLSNPSSCNCGCKPFTTVTSSVPVCLRSGVLECLDDASFHLDFTFVSWVSGHPRPPVVMAPVYRGCPCRDPLGCLRCPGKMASGAERQPLWLRCVGGGGHVMWTLLIHAFYKQFRCHGYCARSNVFQCAQLLTTLQRCIENSSTTNVPLFCQDQRTPRCGTLYSRTGSGRTLRTLSHPTFPIRQICNCYYYVYSYFPLRTDETSKSPSENKKAMTTANKCWASSYAGCPLTRPLPHLLANNIAPISSFSNSSNLGIHLEVLDR